MGLVVIIGFVVLIVGTTGLVSYIVKISKRNLIDDMYKKNDITEETYKKYKL